MSRKVQETMGGIHDVLAESFDAQKVIKLYGGQVTEKQRFFITINDHRRFAMKFIQASVATGPAIQMITAVLLAIIIITSHCRKQHFLLLLFFSFEKLHWWSYNHLSIVLGVVMVRVYRLYLDT